MAKRPQISNVTLVVNEKGLATGTGELADGNSGNNSDTSEIRSGTLTATGGTGPYTYSLISAPAGTYGTFSLNSATGAYTYTLTERYDTSPDADNGTNTEAARDTFTYRVTDANGRTDTATIRVNVVDDKPIARADTNSVTGTAAVSGNVLTDGTDDSFGADEATVSGGGVVGVAKGTSTATPVVGGLGGSGIAGDHGTLTLNANGTYSYTANGTVAAGTTVVDRFVYTIRDGDGDTSTTTLAITVTGTAPAAPVVSDVTVLVNETGLSTGTGELADGNAGNNSDTSEIRSGTLTATGGTGPYTYALISAPAGTYGTFSLNSATGAYTYTLTERFDTSPDADNGTNTEAARDTFTYRVTDASGQSTTATIRVNVVDDVPTARADSGSVTGTAAVSGNVLTDGADDSFGADGPTLAGGGVVGVAKGTSTAAPVAGGLGGTGIVGDHGTLTLNANGTYSYAANGSVAAGTTTVDRFVYTIRDGDGDTSTATLAITVTGTPAGNPFDVSLFGAIGDGVTDDTAAIQAAIDAAHAAGGGIVYMSAGTYKVSGTADKSDGCIRLLDNVTLQGAGMGVTILKVMDNNANAITGVIRTPYNVVTHDVAVYDLTIDGNRANNLNKIDGFYCGVAPGDTRQDYNITLERVEIMNCTGYGFDPHEQTRNLRIADSVAHHNVLDGFVADFIVDSVYENNIAYANDRHGFNITTSTTGLLLLNNVAYDNGSAGLVIQRGSENIPAPSNITIEGGTFYDNAREGIFLKLADGVTITGVDVYGNLRHGIRIDGATDVLIDGALVHNNSQEAAGIYDEIRIGRFNDTAGASGLIFDTTGVIIQNSTIFSDAAILSRFAIYEAPDVEGVNSEAANTIGPVGTGTTFFAPQLVTAAQDQSATAGAAFSYQVAPGSFVDGDDGTFVLSATQESGAALPAWLTFNPATGQFSGTPTAAGTFTVVVQARDAQGLKDTTSFQLVVGGGTPVTDLTGTSGNDTLVGGTGPENIYGLSGDDSLAGRGGADRLDGGGDNDTATYAASAAGVVVDLQAGTGSGGDADGDTLVSIENLTGSALDDQLSGDALANVLLGGGGNDNLIGRAGADTLDGGSGTDRLEGGDGDDLYLIDDAADTIIEFDNLGLGGIDSVRSSIGLVLAANVENLTLLGTANIDATGNGKANMLIGNSGNNVLDGGLGNDTLEGGLGDDTYVVNTASDIVTELAAGGTDTVRSTVARTLETNVENLTLLGALAINGTGNALNNVLTGNDAINILTGNNGDDTLLGAGGDDTLKGGLGADVLDGQAGGDRMEGGDGNDLYHVDNVADTVVELANAGLGGTDTVRSSISLALAVNVENLTLTGAAALNGTGTASANVLIGNDGNNVLEGLAGNDTLQGGLGSDRLIGGSGTDSLDGGAGQDIAVFAGDISTYTVTTTGGSIQIRDNDAIADGNDGTDTLIGIETAEFKGGTTMNLLAPIVLDLDGDGIELIDLANSAAAFDFRGDGVRTLTGWIGSGDAFLVIDRDRNGTVSNASELSFLADKEGAMSDLDGLSAYDTNGDGVISAADDSFASFLLWIDADGDGLASSSEMLSLSAAGIAEIRLAGVATERSWGAGENIVVNTGTFVRIDGSSGALSDVAFRHDPLLDDFSPIDMGRLGSMWTGDLAL